MKRRTLILASAVSALALIGTPAGAAMYDQPWIVAGAWSVSDTIDISTGWRARDTFVLPVTANVTTVTWWGGNVDFTPPYNNPPLLDVTDWEITIWYEGAPLYSEVRSAADVQQGPGTSVFDPVVGELRLYRFRLTLNTAVPLQEGTTYALSIMAFSPTGNPWFCWVPGNGPDGFSVRENLSSGQVSLFDDDRAFEIDGDPLDSDGDGITDNDDNCMDAPNADQRDTDGDSFGNACDADIAPTPNNCLVNFADLDALKMTFFAAQSDVNWNADADFDGNDIVNFADLNIMKDAFFGAPGPSGLPNACD